MCPFIKYVLADSHNEKEQINVMIIPDYKISVVTSFLEMIYTGNTWVEKVTDFEEMKQFGFKLLGFFMGLNMNVKLDKESTSMCTLKPMQLKLPAIEKQRNIPIILKIPPINKSEQMNHTQDESLCQDDNLLPTITKLSDNSIKKFLTKPLQFSSYLENTSSTDIDNIYKDPADLKEELSVMETDIHTFDSNGFFPNTGDFNEPIENTSEIDKEPLIDSLNEKFDHNQPQHLIENYGFPATVTGHLDNPSKRSNPIPVIASSCSDNKQAVVCNKIQTDSNVSELEKSFEEANFEAFECNKFSLKNYAEPEITDMSRLEDSEKELSELKLLINSSEQELSMKIQEKWGWECKFCSVKFLTHHKFIHHNMEIHNESQNFACSLCPEKYSPQTHLDRNHLKTYLNEKKVICDKCGKKFSYKKDLRRHNKNLRSCSNPIMKRYECIYCHSKFSLKEVLNRHIKTFHSVKPLDIQLPENPSKFMPSLPSSFTYNSISEKKLNQREYECKICFEKFLTKHEFRHHYLEIHHDSHPYKCTVCPQKYTTQSHLDSHHKITHRQELDFICDKCGKKFGFKSHLKKHIESLSSCNNMILKRYECGTCHGKFASKEGLNRHFKRIHSKASLEVKLSDNGSKSDNKNGPTLFAEGMPTKEIDSKFLDKNKFLQDSFTTKIGVMNNVKVFKNSEYEVKNFASRCKPNEQDISNKRREPRDWECKSCFEKLPTKNELIHHNLEIHNEKYPFVCSLCPKRYTILGDLEKHHKMLHLNELNFICEKCGKKFGYKNKLERHVKKLRSCDSTK